MRNGIVLAYSDDVAAGVIRTKEGTLHSFPRSSWMSLKINPRNGLTVDFEQGPRHALDVRVREK